MINKLLFCFLLSAFQLFSFSAFAGPVYFPALEMTGATNDVTINVRAVNNPVIYNGNFYHLPKNGTNLTTVAGVVTNSFIPGAYTVSVSGLPKSWTIYVTNNSTAVNAVELSREIVRYSGVQSVTGSAIQVSNDGLGNITITDTNSGSGSGVAVAAGSHVTTATNGSLVTISADMTYALSLSNIVYFGNLTNRLNGTNLVGTITNATTGNAATASTATNVYIAAGEIKEIPFATAATLGVLRFATTPDFTYDSSAKKLILGPDNEISLYDHRHDEGTRVFTYDGLGSSRGLVLTNSGSPVAGLSWYHAGVKYPIENPEWHNGHEAIRYQGGWNWAASSSYVGSYEEGITNGRHAWLIGELGLGWNLGRGTNGVPGNDYTFLTGATTQQITNGTAVQVGPTGPTLGPALTYIKDDDSYLFGSTRRRSVLTGTNVIVGVHTNTLTISSNGPAFSGAPLPYGQFLGSTNSTAFPLTDTRVTLTNFQNFTSSQFTGGQGKMTNTLAGNYRVSIAGTVLTDEAVGAIYKAEFYTNGAHFPYGVTMFSVATEIGQLVSFAKTFRVNLAAGTSCEIKISTSTSVDSCEWKNCSFIIEQ